MILQHLKPDKQATPCSSTLGVDMQHECADAANLRSTVSHKVSSDSVHMQRS